MHMVPRVVALALLILGHCEQGADAKGPLDGIYASLDAVVATDAAQKQLNTPLNIAVGVNAAVDLIVSGTDLFTALGVAAPATARLHDSLPEMNQLAESFAHAFSTGTGSERVFSDPVEYKRIVDVAKNLEKKVYFTGGNAALIGQHLVETAGTKPRDVTLVAAVGPVLNKLLHKDIKVPKGSHVKDDEVHLILEFKLNEQWGSFTASRANRFIFSFDRTNAEMTPLDDFPAAIAEHQPDVIVFSGIHMVEAEPADFRKQRVLDTTSFFEAVEPTRATHLELASLADNDFVKLIADNMISAVDSLGLNEQELKLVAGVGGSPHQDVLQGAFEKPEVAVIADLIHWLLTTYGNKPNARLSRVHFHTLGFHLMGAYKGHWGDVGAATTWGAVSCSQRACRVTDRHQSGEPLEGMVTHRMEPTFALHKGDAEPKLAMVRDFDPGRAVVRWERDGIAFAMAPVLVCTPPEKTVGLGDSISAAGLEMHKFKYRRHVTDEL